MSGKRQHFIPRFLQTAFQSHANGEEVYAWVYREGAAVFNTNIINIGVEGFFYSQEGDNQVDDDITTIERPFSDLVDALRNDPDDSVRNSVALAELLAHLEVRTRHIRESFSITARIVTEGMLRLVDDPAIFGNYLKRRIDNDPSFMQDAIKEELSKRGLPNALLPLAMQASKPWIDQILPSVLADMPLLTNHLRNALPKMLQKSSKEGHLKSLGQSPSPIIRAQQYYDFEFRILETPLPNLPLGDSILVFQVHGERPFKPISEKDDIIQHVFLPLSPRTVLVGSRERGAIDLQCLPLAVAQCSLEFFISDSRNKENDGLQQHIGEYAYWLSDSQIITLLSEILLE